MDALQQLLDRLNNVLDAMADITTINSLITQLVAIEKSESEEYQKLQRLKEQMEKKLLEELVK
jgi:hypothetical protein